MYALVPLQRIATVFPLMQGHARAIVTKVQLIRDGDDERTDLKNAAKLYAGALEKRLPQLREGV